MQYAMEVLNADYIATGHYCQRSFNTKRAHLLRGNDNNKDQSYFLHAIEQNVLERVLFPVGDIEKPQVRAIADKLGLATAKKKVLSVKSASMNSYLSTFLQNQV